MAVDPDTTLSWPANDGGTVPLRSTVAWFVYDSDGTLSAGAFGGEVGRGRDSGSAVICENVCERRGS